MSDLALLERLNVSLRELAALSRDQHRIGPFWVFIDPLRRSKYLSFAQPDAGAEAGELAAALPEVRALFRAHDRQPRTEHVEELCPALADVAEAASWTLSERVTVMVATPATLALPPSPDGLVVERLGPDVPDARIIEYMRAQERAFGEDPEDIVPEVIARWRDQAAHGFYVAGLFGGEIVGSAIATRVVGGVSEVVGVATVPEHRRRGIAGSLTGAAVAAAFAGGAQLAFLSAADEAAGRIYAKAGFAFEGWQRGYDGPAP